MGKRLLIDYAANKNKCAAQFELNGQNIVNNTEIEILIQANSPMVKVKTYDDGKMTSSQEFSRRYTEIFIDIKENKED